MASHAAARLGVRPPRRQSRRTANAPVGPDYEPAAGSGPDDGAPPVVGVDEVPADDELGLARRPAELDAGVDRDEIERRAPDAVAVRPSRGGAGPPTAASGVRRGSRRPGRRRPAPVAVAELESEHVEVHRLIGDRGRDDVGVGAERDGDLGELERVAEADVGVALRDGSAFGLVGVEQTIVGVIVCDRGQLPREVVCVLDPGVEAEAAGRGEAVGGVADQEDRSVAKPRRDLRGHRPGRHGDDLERQRRVDERGADEPAATSGVGHAPGSAASTGCM